MHKVRLKVIRECHVSSKNLVRLRDEGPLCKSISFSTKSTHNKICLVARPENSDKGLQNQQSLGGDLVEGVGHCWDDRRDEDGRVRVENWPGVSGEKLLDELQGIDLHVRCFVCQGAGLVTNSILFCWLLSIKDQCENVGFFAKEKSRFASIVLDGVLGPLHLWRHTWRCPHCITEVWEATHEVRGLL